MKLSTFLIIATVAHLIFGLGMLLVPGPFLSVLGVTLDETGVTIARILGAAISSMGLMFWWSRNAAYSETLQVVLRASLVYHLVDVPIDLLAIQSGVMNSLAWSVVVLHLLLAFGFAFFGFAGFKAALSSS